MMDDATQPPLHTENATQGAGDTHQDAPELIPPPTLPEIKRPTYAVYDRKTETRDGTFRAGVWYHGLKEKADSPPVPSDSWICSPLHVDAITSNDGADFGRLLRFRNTLGHWREWAMPMHLLKGSGEELRGELLNMGVEIDPHGHRLLNSYLQSQHPRRQVTAATATGWHSPTLFIMPRLNIGDGDAIYQSEAANADDYRQGGTLDGWQSTIGAFCPGNPLLQLAIGCALAGPLLHHAQRLGGGFHIVGGSSCGKSTTVEAAASAWGHGEHFKRTWRATDNGLEGIAAQRNDTLLVLDEIGEADGRIVGNIVYALANGTGKARANRTGAARAARRWRIMVLSSGEKNLADIMAAAGKQTNAGQELRLISIPAERLHGAWDNLHSFASGADLSNRLKVATQTHFGHLGPEFVRRLVESGIASAIPATLESLVGHFPAADGQQSRVADRFALVALALEMAVDWGLLPLAEGEGLASMKELFTAWKDDTGDGPSEDRAILRAVSDYLDTQGGAAFAPLHGGDRQRAGAGWWVDDGNSRLWLFTSPGLEMAAPGFGAKRIAQALDKAAWLAEKDHNRLCKNYRTPEGFKRLYCVRLGSD